MNTKVENQMSFQMTVAQRHMLELCQSSPEALRAYSDTLIMDISGKLDRYALRGAIEQLVSRHQILRVVFSDDAVNCIVRDKSFIDASYVRIQQGTRSSSTEAEQWIEYESDKAFDLSEKPLIRFRLAQLAEHEHILIIQSHHLICDGWSQSIIADELAKLYSSLVSDTGNGLADAPKFSEYAKKLNVTLRTEPMQAKKSFWTKILSSDIEEQTLPYDKPSHGGSFKGCSTFHKLGGERSRRIAEDAKSNRCTLNMFLYALYTAYIYKICGSTKFILPISTGGRYDSADATLVGHCTSIMPVLNHIDASLDFSAHVETTKKALLNAYDNQGYPYADILEELNDEAGFSVDGLIKASFNFNVDMPPPQFHGLETSYRVHAKKYAGSEILFNFTRMDDDLLLECNYQTQRFSEHLVAQLIEGFTRFIDTVLKEPDVPMRNVQRVSEQQRGLMDTLFCQTSPSLYAPKTVKEMLELGCASGGSRIAIEYGDNSVSFSELNARANRLARQLKSNLNGRVRRVGIYMDRSIEMMTCLLACYKASITYIPLDPSSPIDRTDYINDQAELDLILTVDKYEVALSAYKNKRISLNGEAYLQSSEGFSSDNLTDEGLSVNDRSLAYINFTSGSTGRPKGVMVSQCSISHYVSYAKGVFPSNHIDAVVAVQPLVFDASLNTLLLAVCASKKLILTDDSKPFSQTLPNYLMSSDTHYLFTLTPSHLSALRHVESIDVNERARHQFLIGGEAMTNELIGVWADNLFPQSEFLNQYGPTEATVGVTIEVMSDRAGLSIARTGNVSIGRRNSNVSLFVLDENQNRVPLGFAGELYIGGSIVTEGYLNDKEQTLKKYVIVPGLSSGKLYRTGDRVRWHEDGRLDFIGRIDNQVKLRGFRIELDEIKAVIQSSRQVSNCGVVITGAEDAQQITAYVQLNRETALNSTEQILGEQGIAKVRELALSTLPHYMVPSEYKIVSSIPMTRNGKIDVRRLEDFVCAEQCDSPSCLATTESEKVLATLWSTNLKRTCVDVSQDYFSAGGNSLLVIRLANDISRTFKVKINSDELILNSSIKGMAALVDKMSASKCSEVRAIPKLNDASPTVLSFGQKRLWFLSLMEEDRSNFNITAAIKITGQLDVQRLSDSFSEIVRRHQILRTTYIEHNGEPLQKVNDTPFIMNSVDLDSLADEAFYLAVQQQAHEESERVFDLERDLMLRVKLIKQSPTVHIMIVTLHHIAADGWSIGLLINELNTLYGLCTRDVDELVERNNLPTLDVQYRDFAQWQVEEFDKNKEVGLAFWEDNLSNIPVCHSLALDKPRPTWPSLDGCRYVQTIPATTLGEVKELCAHTHVTLFMVLRSALAVLLHHYSGKTDIVFGTPAASRPEKALEYLIGLFVNNVVLRNTVDGRRLFSDFLSDTKQRSMKETRHNSVPFDALVERLNPERVSSHAPIFQILLSMQNNEAGEFSSDAITLSKLDLGYTISKYDLTLDVTECDGQLEVQWEYAVDLFDHSTIVMLSEAFESLLNAIVDRPHATINQMIDGLPVRKSACSVHEHSESAYQCA